ncbi:MAG: hypothetical protein N3D84_03815, partial [Candidatus Woesearchaeota archaeon]|nr:hypothetical protein [Candidatus Woesearchaeota archaeon]
HTDPDAGFPKSTFTLDESHYFEENVIVPISYAPIFADMLEELYKEKRIEEFKDIEKYADKYVKLLNKLLAEDIKKEDLLNMHDLIYALYYSLPDKNKKEFLEKISKIFKSSTLNLYTEINNFDKNKLLGTLKNIKSKEEEKLAFELNEERKEIKNYDGLKKEDTFTKFKGFIEAEETLYKTVGFIKFAADIVPMMLKVIKK